MAGYRWARIDTQLLTNPKLDALDTRCALLYVALILHAVHETTDGFVTDRGLRECTNRARVNTRRANDLALRLQAAGLLSRRDAGWYIEGYAEHQRQALRENVERGRELLRARQAAWRARRNGVTNADDTTRHDTDVYSPLLASDAVPSSNGVTPSVIEQLGGWSPFAEDGP